MEPEQQQILQQSLQQSLPQTPQHDHHGDLNASTMSQQEDENLLREQDRFLPIASVARIMKSVLPENVKISKEAKECMQEVASEFVCFIASEASDRCQHEKRKVIVGTDIVTALHELGFESYAAAIRLFYDKYRIAAKQMADDHSTKRDIRMSLGGMQ